jgi:putative transcriptional regulator
MSRHPAPDELLLDYAAGVLPKGPALVVSIHVALDPAARDTFERLRAVGGALLESEPESAIDETALDRVMAQLNAAEVEPKAVPAAAKPGFEWAPPVLRRHLGANASWKRVVDGLEEIRIRLPGDSHRVSLLRLEPGKGLPVHRHVANEYTVVMQGGYSDVTGSYGVGDFAVGPGPQEHEPIADPGEPCIALIVVDKPVVLTGPWGRWLNPLIRWGWL